MQKKSTDARVATGRYFSRVWSMSLSVTSASATLEIPILADLEHRLIQGVRDVVGGDLGLREGVDQLLVVEDVPGAVAQHVQDLILEVLELRLHARVGHHELVLRLGEVAALLHHHRAEELILQAVERDEKVEQRNLHAHLWLIVRVAHLGRHVEPEVRVVRDDVVAHLDHLAAALLERLLLQQGLERGVQLFADVLE